MLYEMYWHCAMLPIVGFSFSSKFERPFLKRYLQYLSVSICSIIGLSFTISLCDFWIKPDVFYMDVTWYGGQSLQANKDKFILCWHFSQKLTFVEKSQRENPVADRSNKRASSDLRMKLVSDPPTENGTPSEVIDIDATLAEVSIDETRLYCLTGLAQFFCHTI